ncbi:hypothetical protein GCM10010914_05290 [Deinococcus wulumuqiensis]|uniref:Uncharacterized protein n=1 Tax=Deinococcus wulumuqiensis TaxID=980427 RepID=A0AAV4K3M3_9DEIO|nr:hypothetical protein GCM10010914_05290 [Deinococcus wulumuqiensis]GGP29842.1 hypothetical protein GCM10008021_14930 [Deinococcus wulumuqiensis]
MQSFETETFNGRLLTGERKRGQQHGVQHKRNVEGQTLLAVQAPEQRHVEGLSVVTDQRKLADELAQLLQDLSERLTFTVQFVLLDASQFGNVTGHACTSNEQLELPCELPIFDPECCDFQEARLRTVDGSRLGIDDDVRSDVLFGHTMQLRDALFLPWNEQVFALLTQLTSACFEETGKQ